MRFYDRGGKIIHHVEIVVVGGGVIGCAIAFELSRRGKKILLLEQDRIGSDASAAAAGMITQVEMDETSPLFSLSKQSKTIFPEWVCEVTGQSGMDVGWTRKGLLKVVVDEEEAKRLKRVMDFGRESDESRVWLSAEETRSLEPFLTKEVLGSVYIPDDGHVRALDWTVALARSAVAYGGEVKEFMRVESLEIRHGAIEGIRTQEEWISCDQVIVAAGIFSGVLLKRAGLGIPIYPVKGEIFSVMGRTPILKRIIYTDQGYFVPKNNGSILVGATEEKDSYDRRVTLAGLFSLAKFATRLVPDIGKMEWEKAWAGLRPQTPTGLPYLGEHPRCKGLFVAAGHFRNGILLSPVTGKLMADLVEGKGSKWKLASFSIPSEVHFCDRSVVDEFVFKR